MALTRYDVLIETGPIPDDSSLLLMRFPAMRSQFENIHDQIHLSFRPKSMRFKLEIALDSGSSGYCQQQAQILGGKSTPKTFSNGAVNSNFYSSTKTTIEDEQLFVAKIVNGKLICRPISHILTMRSDLCHFDLKDEIDPKEEIRPISVKFAAPDRQHAPNRNQVNSSDTDDPLDEFKSLDYKTTTSREALLQRTLLFGQQVAKVKPDPDALPEDVKPPVVFIPDVKPKIERMDVEDIYGGETSILISPKKSNQVKQSVRDCLLRAKIVSFEEVYCFLKDTHSNSRDNIQLNNKDILDALVESALLVQGNWAIKSEILYGDSSERECTDVTGISINLFIAARDYLLWLFTQNRIVSRLEYSRKVKMPDYDILELFKQLSTFRRDIKKWELKVPTDNRFLEKFPDVVQRQATIWKVRRANKLSIFNV